MLIDAGNGRADVADAIRARRLVVISYMARAPFSPRGIRTRALVEDLRRDWAPEVIAGPISATPEAARPQRGAALLRKILRFAHSSVMFDKYELWSRQRFRSWEPDATAALLIGFPFSPLVYASRRLADHGIPYVVDAGDTWVLTSTNPEVRGLGRLRGRAAEYRLWNGAAGGVVTTEAQAQALRSLFPELPILVRPNGFSTGDQPRRQAQASRPRRSVSLLRLAHFGDISSDRVEIATFLEALARSGQWKEVQFHQFGSDWAAALASLREVTVVFHHPRPWREIVAAAGGEYDLAVVIGNRDPMLLPSKAVSYLQLPVPRVAVVDGTVDDALTAYLRDKAGWTVVPARARDAAEKVRMHLARGWTDAELAPPPTEAWTHVSRAIRQFLENVLSEAPHPSPHAPSSETSGLGSRGR